MPSGRSGAKPKQKKQSSQLTGALTVVDLLMASRTLQAQQDGCRHNTRDAASPTHAQSGNHPDPQTKETSQILQQLMDIKTYVVAKIARSSREVKAEIQALGMRIAALETRVETVAIAHNEVVTHATQLKKHLLNLELEMEALSNRSRRNNLRIYGLPEDPNDTRILFKTYCSRRPR
ncbi:Hypothetical predicted protein [Pelobates cultripes]|uniref:Uncharacterized protein n=1 Tax=Pelobates cultripes TaxID=61616 RepID=A0AAD1WU76_PELCU|nr:Hypothetical predicted protein [Pelobates cultripes]